MDDKQKISHLLRRFGLGASYSEMEFYGKLGVEGTIERLIEFEKYPESFEVSALQFTNRNQQGVEMLNMPAVTAWWALRMMATHRPLQEKLTLFWHDHFAVSASKVNQPLMMLDYLETLRRNSAGKFRQMLLDVSRSAAMIRWLDNDTNVRGKPNENFAREIMELFTLGIGNYSEADIQEAARAFTGWTFAPNVDIGEARRQGKRPQELQLEVARSGKPAFVFRFVERLHDTGVKKVLDNEGPFGGEDICDFLAVHPTTAEYLCTKLWEWFCYPNPEEAVVAKLAKVFLDSGTQIKPVLYAIARSNEFWSEKCVRRQVKNPVDFTLAICRQLGLGVAAVRALDSAANQRAPLAAPRSVDVQMERQGMKLLFPPDVAGWDWGGAWVNSATMLERIKVADSLFGTTATRHTLAIMTLGDKPTQTSREVVEAYLSVVDAKLPPEKVNSLIAVCDAAGGAEAARNPRRAGDVALAVYRTLFAAPEFQLC